MSPIIAVPADWAEGEVLPSVINFMSEVIMCQEPLLLVFKPLFTFFWELIAV